MADTIPTQFTVPLVEYTRLAAERDQYKARLAAIEEIMLLWNSDANYTDQNAIYAIDALTLEGSALATDY